MLVDQWNIDPLNQWFPIFRSQWTTKTKIEIGEDSINSKRNFYQAVQYIFWVSSQRGKEWVKQRGQWQQEWGGVKTVQREGGNSRKSLWSPDLPNFPMWSQVYICQYRQLDNSNTEKHSKVPQFF